MRLEWDFVVFETVAAASVSLTTASVSLTTAQIASATYAATVGYRIGTAENQR